MLVKIKKTVYDGTEPVIGEVVNATPTKDQNYLISKEELVRVGANPRCFSDEQSYCFYASEVEVLD